MTVGLVVRDVNNDLANVDMLTFRKWYVNVSTHYLNMLTTIKKERGDM